MQVKPSQASTLLATYIKAGLTPMMSGSPGIGKSQIVYQLANEYNLKVIDVRLAQCDPTDLLGFPSIKGAKAGYVPMETFPLESDPVPEGYSGWVLFLDELTSASLAVQAAGYKLILDRMVGTSPLHKNVAIIGAGNLESDNAIVQPMSTALQSRLAHMELTIDLKEWLNWAAENHIDHRITSYLNFKPGNLYTFQPDHTDKTYACPRTYEFASRVLKLIDIGSPTALPMLAGVLSDGVARELLDFCKIEKELPKIQDIVSDPKGTTLPSEPGTLFALTGSLAHHATKENVSAILEYAERMPPEFQVVCLRELIRRNKSLMSSPAVQKWLAKAGEELF